MNLIFASILSTYKLVSGAVPLLSFYGELNELRFLSQIGNTERVFSKNSLCLTEYIYLFCGSTFLRRVGSWAQDPVAFRATLASEVSGDAGGRTLRETLADKHQQKLTLPISR